MGAHKRRARLKGRSTSGRFALVPVAVLDSLPYAALSWPARALLLDVAGQYSGANNGDLTAAHAVLRKRGWQRSTLQAAAAELEAAGFIVRTRQGGRNTCNLYAVTWQPIDDCPGKRLDHGYPVGGPPLRLWTKTETLARQSG